MTPHFTIALALLLSLLAGFFFALCTLRPRNSIEWGMCYVFAFMFCFFCTLGVATAVSP